MTKINKPIGLIKYASEATIAENQPFIITARLKAYIVVLVILLTAFIAILFTRSSVELKVIKAAGQLYIETPDGKISNMYNFMLINKSHKHYDSLEMKLDGDGVIELVNGHKYISLKKEGSIKSTLFIKIPANKIMKRKQAIKVNLYHRGQLIEVEKTNFLGPVF
jgi:polyferredoxin